jgi:hypothetical protein
MTKRKEKLGKPKIERKSLTREEWLAEVFKDIDPLKYAGEGWYATEEYPIVAGISSPFTRAEIGKEGDYYPGVYREDVRRALKKITKGKSNERSSSK